jgi:DNA polymerase epsilon subunit 3
MPRKESATGPISAIQQQEAVSDGIENYELPKSLVTKIAKAAVRTAIYGEIILKYFE